MNFPRLFNKNTCYLLPHDLRRSKLAEFYPGEHTRLDNMRTVETDTGYSFKPFLETKSIFVHIPKTAGVSICKALYGNLSGGHTPIKKYMLAFSKTEFYDSFKFAFVRNPWDRLQSAFHFLKQGGFGEKDKAFARSELSTFTNFDSFVYNWVSEENILKYNHFIPQYQFLQIPFSTKLHVDFLGFFENLAPDFEYISQRVSHKPDYNHQLAHLNRGAKKTSTTDYRSHYSDKTVDIVAKTYAKDIELFGYDFDNASINTQIRNRFKRTL